MAKEEERSEVKVKKGPEGFPFLKGEKYVFSYSFRAVEGMKVSKRFTFLGQLKGSKGGYMIKGDPIYSLTANNHGLNVRFRCDGVNRGRSERVYQTCANVSSQSHSCCFLWLHRCPKIHLVVDFLK